MAKIVLDEIGRRLKVVEELYMRTTDPNTREVQDLQPLFEKGLWIFGPEFETIEYTSNVGMTRVVQDLFKEKNGKGTRLRPDFAILPDGTSGLYSYPRYDREGAEIGTDSLVVVELKKPNVPIGNDQKSQCWKYVKELFDKGLLQARVTRVTCFVLGSRVDTLENSARTELENTVIIQPMLFETILQRAKSRLLNLHKKVENAPFLEQHRQELLDFLNIADEAPNLFSSSLT